MTIRDQIQADLKEAMRARDQRKLNTLRLVTAAVKQIEVDERIVVDESRMLGILDKLAKQRQESIQQFKAGGRDDLVDQEAFELALIRHYLPEPLQADEIKTLIDEACLTSQASDLRDLGKVMTYLKPLLQGRADMSQVSAMVKAKLS